MNTSGNSVTACKLCQHYNPEGRRGGFCEKLDVPVISTWEACSLADHPFETSWYSTEAHNAFLNESFHERVSTVRVVEIPELQEINMRSLSLTNH